MTNILPISASTVQRDLDQSIGPAQQTHNTVASIPGIKYNPPDFMLPWLIWEYGLEQLLPYLADPRLAIREGVRWQRVRGTPASLTMALGWLGLNDTNIESEIPGEHFYQYQVETGRIVKNTELENVRAVAGFSAPLRARLSRLYHGFDVRHLVLDHSEYGALLSNYSGIRKDSLVLSFGRQHDSLTTLDGIQVGSAAQPLHTSRVADIHWPGLDGGPIGGVETKIARYAQWYTDVALQSHPWVGSWDNRSWNTPNYWFIGTRHNSAAQ